MLEFFAIKSQTQPSMNLWVDMFLLQQWWGSSRAPRCVSSKKRPEQKRCKNRLKRRKIPLKRRRTSIKRCKQCRKLRRQNTWLWYFQSRIQRHGFVLGTGLVLLGDLIFSHCERFAFINQVPPRLDNNFTQDATLGFSLEMGVGQSLSLQYLVLPEDPHVFFCMCAFSLEVAQTFFSLKPRFFVEAA